MGERTFNQINEGVGIVNAAFTLQGFNKEHHMVMIHSKKLSKQACVS